MFIIDRYDSFIENAEELHQHSLYFLIGEDTHIRKQKVYIGQTQDAKLRISQHETKDWWTKVIVFNCQNEPLFDRTTVQYLEYQSIKEAIECGECQLMENCQIPQEPYTDRKDYILNIFGDIKTLLSFASYDWFENKIYDIQDCYSAKNNIAKRIAKEMSRKINVEPDDYDEKIISYVLNEGAYFAEAIVIDNDKIMILPVSRLNVNGNYELLRKHEDSFDWISGNLKKDIICETLEEAAEIICNNKNAKWTENVKQL